jgi:hypothetical protein
LDFISLSAESETLRGFFDKRTAPGYEEPGAVSWSKNLPKEENWIGSVGELEGAGRPPRIGSNAPKALLGKD